MYTRLLAEIAACQHGLITHEQALEYLGLARLRRWLKTGRLVAVRRGIYRLAGAPPTWRQSLLAVVLAAEPVWSSHRSAAAVHGLIDRIGPPEMLVVSPRWVRLPGVRVHRTNCLPEEHRTVVDGIPVTTLVRTAFDMSAVVPPERFGQLLDRAWRMRPSLLDEMDECLQVVSARGRRRTTIVRAMLELRGEDARPGGSNAELDHLVRVLRAARLGRLVQQHKVVVGDRTYYLDAAYPDELVACEFDTYDTHGSRTSFDHDRRRDADLQLAGWMVLRATSTTPPEQIVATTRAALRLRRAETAHGAGQRGKVAG